jgi:predicted CopG family antitoxin
MTKVISLSNEAYTELKRRKAQGESFSDVVLKIVKGKRSDSILQFSGRWTGGDADEVQARLTKERHNARSR